MTTEADDTIFVCHKCIGDPFLANDVQAEQISATCTYCGDVKEATTLDDLAEGIHEVLQQHFRLTPSEPSPYEYALAKEGLWWRSGDPVAIIIAEIAGLSEEITTEVVAYLADRYGDYGEDSLYGDNALYEERGPDDSVFRETWEEFRSEMRFRARFFSTYAEEALTQIFGDLSADKAFGGKPVIREMNPDDEDSFIWRARTAHSTKELKTILRSPASEIGPPPSRLAKGGRMNAPGIPVFYGAVTKKTCVAEARAPVGSYVVLAKFEVLRPIRLLDSDALIEIYVEGSYFDPDFARRNGRAAFLERLVREISRPVMRQDEAFEHLATQAVAEFLANKVEPRLDGIIFHSSQTGGSGCNVVLFNHACRVETYELPENAEVTVNLLAEDDDDAEGEITVVMIESPEQPKEAATDQLDVAAELMDIVNSFSDWDEGDHEDDEPPNYAEPTLRLDRDSVVVHDIKAVKYRRRRRNVSWHDIPKEEEKDS